MAHGGHVAGGFRRAVINTAWLGEQIEAHFGSSFAAPGMGTAALQLQYSREGRDFGAALETLGGVCRALPLLGDAFWVMAGDVFAPDFAMEQSAVQRFLDSGMLAHLWLVPNPPHVPLGDFALDAASGLALNTRQAGSAQGLPRYTFSTFGLYRKALFLPPWCAIAEGKRRGKKCRAGPFAAPGHGAAAGECRALHWLLDGCRHPRAPTATQCLDTVPANLQPASLTPSPGHGTPCPYDLTPPSSPLPPTTSLLTPTTSLLTPQT